MKQNYYMILDALNGSVRFKKSKIYKTVENALKPDDICMQIKLNKTNIKILKDLIKTLEADLKKVNQ